MMQTYTPHKSIADIIEANSKIVAEVEDAEIQQEIKNTINASRRAQDNLSTLEKEELLLIRELLAKLRGY